MRTRGIALAVAATVGLLGVSGPASAAGLPGSAVMSLAVYDPAAADRMFVQWLSVEDPRLAVRSAARSALLSSTGDAAIATFLNTGYDAAIVRAEQTRTRNVDFTTRMVATHPAQYYPRVNAAGNRALAGTDAQLDEFVRTGYAAALELDRSDIDDDNEQAAEIRQEDRDFVVRLSVDDPGAQVRAWAVRAVAPGTTDADVVEFFQYGWVSASGLDMQKHRTRIADEDRRWRVQSRRLVAEAEAAEKAARETAGEAQVQARAAAARAWAAVGAQTGPARVAWADAEQVALHQADTWLAVSQAAGTATSSNWLAIAGAAPATRTEWLTEQENAAAQAASWIALYQQALAAETAMSTPAA
jgi:hypothetical protein